MSRLAGSLRFAVPLLASAFGIAAVAVIAASTPPAETPTDTAQPDNPAPPARVAGAGVVEPASRLVALAPRRAGVIAAVTVAPGDRVDRGDQLLQLDDSEALAQLRGREAEVRAAEAALRVAEVAANEAASERERYRAIGRRNAISAQELSRRDYADARARAERDMAAAALGAAKAAREVAAAELAGLAVVAPFDGVVLQVNAKAGEYAAAGGSAEPLVVLGAAPPLQVRIDIDEADIVRLDATAPGEVRSRGVPAQRWPITPVRVEPLVVPKRSLSNRADERVDTRVLQVVYRLPADASDVFPGQLVDAYLPARQR